MPKYGLNAMPMMQRLETMITSDNNATLVNQSMMSTLASLMSTMASKSEDAKSDVDVGKSDVDDGVKIRRRQLTLRRKSVHEDELITRKALRRRKQTETRFIRCSEDEELESDAGGARQNPKLTAGTPTKRRAQLECVTALTHQRSIEVSSTLQHR
ncbi:hypothetical protein C5167_006271 [Papaver somniferum]|uniref:Uncharacterized protein n=1 Tax=Papaver somniferum TaxID=3469 RepID=A0A4Y7JGP2_PAPSO|nr:hypothetical protein C5167_006271 [Papaver somniferum]